MTTSASPTAADLDASDPLAPFRTEFNVPEGVYLVGNSLGALPKSARAYVDIEFDRWQALGVEGHFTGELAWTSYHELVTDQLAAIVGAQPNEVVAMNGLTVNLHLLMVSFYRPTSHRHKILIEQGAFPSDHFAAESQIRHHGFDPRHSLILLEPRPDEETLRRDDILATIAKHGQELALILLPGVQYYTGQVLPMVDIIDAGHAVGAKVGLDLAHAVGNIELSLHDWDVDFAAWCSYKYLNSGPGGVAGAFVHDRFVNDQTLPKFLGWWGTKLTDRFKMTTEFEAMPTAESWQLSNAPVLPLATLRASLDVFDKVGGVSVLRRKAERQIEFLDRRLAEELGGRVENITPRPLAERGCQSSLRLASGNGRKIFEQLSEARVICDWREPDVVRIAPVPLYNSFSDIEQFVNILGGIA